MLKIGITGGIASGKSSAATFLATNYHWLFCSADEVCRDLLRKRQPGWHVLTKEFGGRFLDAHGNIDRCSLRMAVFSDAACRQAINQLLHPLIRKKILTWLASSGDKDGNANILLAEIPLLFEVGWEDDFDEIVSVYASRKQSMQRLCRRDGMSEKVAAAVLATQLPPDNKALRAHHVIDNSGVWLDTCLQLICLANLVSEKA